MENWPVLMSFTYPHEAHLAKGYLESNGIETIIQDELMTQIYSLYSNALGGAKLLVKESDYEQGIQLLKDGGYLIEENSETESKPEIVLSDKTTNKKICPFCGSENIGKKRETGVLMIIVYFLIGMLIPIFKSSHLCFDCGKIWKYSKRKV
jgi:hypothetical protein